MVGSNLKRLEELKRLVKAAANRSEEVRCQIEVLRQRDEVLRQDVVRYVREIKELTGVEFPLKIHETAPDRESREDHAD